MLAGRPPEEPCFISLRSPPRFPASLPLALGDACFLLQLEAEVSLAVGVAALGPSRSGWGGGSTSWGARGAPPSAEIGLGRTVPLHVSGVLSSKTSTRDFSVMSAGGFSRLTKGPPSRSSGGGSRRRGCLAFLTGEAARAQGTRCHLENHLIPVPARRAGEKQGPDSSPPSARAPGPFQVGGAGFLPLWRFP